MDPIATKKKDSFSMVDASFHTIMVKFYDGAPLCSHTLRKYKTYLRQCSAFLCQRFPGGIEEVQQEDDLLPVLNDFITKLKEERKGPSAMETCISAVTHVPPAYAKWKGVIPKFLGRTRDMANLLKKRKWKAGKRQQEGRWTLRTSFQRCSALQIGGTSCSNWIHGIAWDLHFVSKVMRGDTLRRSTLARITHETYEHAAPDKLPYLVIHAETKI